LIGESLPYWREDWRLAALQGWQPTAADVAKQLDSYRGGWLEEFRHRWQLSLVAETLGFALFVFWRAGGLMLIGMAVFKLGVFSAARSARFYATLLAVAACLGIPTILYGVYTNERVGWENLYVKFVGGEFNYWASIVVSLGWVGLVMLIYKSPRLRPLIRPLAAVGQMALTNYLMHTLICTTLFYGHGFGQFGKVERVGQIGIVFAIWAFQLAVSPLWLHYFRFGPAEWLWRAMTYWKLPPLRRRGEPAVQTATAMG
jgi:uncharacterized protein